MPSHIQPQTVVFKANAFVAVRVDEEEPTDFWIARVHEDITWKNRKKDIPIVWYEFTAADGRVTASLPSML